MMNNASWKVPDHTYRAFVDYVDRQYEPGSFMMAVLTNDLYGAVCRADTVNKQHLPEIIKFVLNELPPGSYGSVANVRLWLRGCPEQEEWAQRRFMEKLTKDHTV
jgi:hypothetical protein